jgi:hypothetical protein
MGLHAVATSNCKKASFFATLVKDFFIEIKATKNFKNLKRHISKVKLSTIPILARLKLVRQPLEAVF